MRIGVFTKTQNSSLAECEHNWQADKERREIKQKKRNISEKVAKKKVSLKRNRLTLISNIEKRRSNKVLGQFDGKKCRSIFLLLTFIS